LWLRVVAVVVRTKVVAVVRGDTEHQQALLVAAQVQNQR
jgi:hypothetical protein